METQVQRPQQWKDVHQDEQNHRRHDECHFQLIIAHPARHLRFHTAKGGGGLHIIYESRQQRSHQSSEKRCRNTNISIEVDNQ